MADTLDLLDASLLHVAAPETPVAQLGQWPEPLKAGCRRFGINGVRPVAALLAQSAHESGGFQRLSENLNYSAERLCAVWPHRFPTLESAQPYAHNPEALANFVYANRMGNGPPESGDGWRNRGEGLFQLTGHDNFAMFASSMQLDVEAVPSYCGTPNGAAMSACWFFVTHNLIDLSKTPGVRDDTVAINGGTEGLADRKRRFDAVVAELLRRGS